MLWSTVFFAVGGLAAAVSPRDTPYRPGVAPSPFPAQAANARIHIDADTACEFADDTSKPRNIQLAAWVECQVLALYPYPRSASANDTDWLPGYEKAFHPDGRFSFNNTRYNYDGFREVYKGFSKAIGAAYGTGWQQWREFYVVSPDSWDPQGKGGVITAQGYNGGILRGQTTAINYPNAGYFVVKEIEGRRWITELREHGTNPSATTLPKDGQKWPCDPVVEVCT